MGLLSGWLQKRRTEAVTPYVLGDVLDLGCGSAVNSRMSNDRITSYYGVEQKQSDVDNLKKTCPDSKFFRRDLDVDKLNLKMKFDRILLIAVIEHIFNQKHLFREILNHLKKDGKIVITTPTVFGNDVIYRIGNRMGLFGGKVEENDHIVIYNRKRFEVIAEEFNLRIEKYKKFELGCNQLVVLSKK